MECKYCGREFDSERGLNIHIGKKHPDERIIKCDYCGKEIQIRPFNIERSKHHFCSRECHNKFRRKRVTIECDYCGKKINKKISDLKDHNFCSQECYHKWTSDKGIFRGENNSRWEGEKLKCDYCGEEFYRKPSRIREHNFCSKKCEGKWKSEHPEAYNQLHTPKVKEKIKQYSKKHPEKAEHLQSLQIKKKVAKSLVKRPNKPERRVIDIIEEHNLPFKYVGDGEKFIGDLNPDFVNGKKVIEIFGDPFHKNETFKKGIDWKRTEFGRKAYFSQLGYDTLILWTSEMKKMSDERIVKKIREWCNEKKDGNR